MIGAAFLLVVGLTCVAVGALAWAGRWRAWTRLRYFWPIELTLLVPAVGLAWVGIALSALFFPDGFALLGVMVAGVMLVASLVTWWSPPWLAPSWLREDRRHGRAPSRESPLPDNDFPVAASPEELPSDAPTARLRARWVLPWLGPLAVRIDLHDDAIVIRQRGTPDPPLAVMIAREHIGRVGTMRRRCRTRLLIDDEHFRYEFVFALARGRRPRQRLIAWLESATGQPLGHR